MVTMNTDALANDEYVSLEDAAKMLGVTYVTVLRATSGGIVTTVRLPGKGNRKYIPRFEIDALEGISVNSRKAKEHLEQVRRERGMGEKQYNIDNTPDWMGESEIKKALDEVTKAMEIMRRQQEQMMKDHAEFEARVKETAAHMLSLSFKDMMKEIISERFGQEVDK